MKKEKPIGLHELTIQGACVEVDVTVHPADPTVGIMSPEVEVHAVWVGDQDITDTTMHESIQEDIEEALLREYRQSRSLSAQMQKAYQKELDQIDAKARGWASEVTI